MKKIFTFFAVLAAFFAMAQITIPETSEKGVLILQNNSQVNYRDLKYEKGKVTYVNANTNETEFVYDASIVEIRADNSEKNSDKTSVVENSFQKLGSDAEIKNFLLQSNNQNYIKGKKLNNTGTAFLVGGAACFVVGGILNLTSASDAQPTPQNPTIGSQGSPVPLIIGLAGMGAGLVMKISGKSKIKKAVHDYKTAESGNFTPVYYLVNSSTGIGIKVNF